MTNATKKAVEAKSAKGKTLFPGKINDNINVIGIKIAPTNMVVVCPIIIAESKPILNS